MTIPISSGWNLELFDMPYLVGRIDRIFGDSAKNSLSPYSMTRKKLFAVITENYSRLISRVSSNLITWTCTKSLLTRSKNLIDLRLYC